MLKVLAHLVGVGGIVGKLKIELVFIERLRGLTRAFQRGGEVAVGVRVVRAQANSLLAFVDGSFEIVLRFERVRQGQVVAGVLRA